MNGFSLRSDASAVIGRSMRRTVLTGGAIAAVFFVGVGGWASWAPLSGAAVAPAVVSPEGNRRTVQHLEGGIVKEILVKGGDEVEAGQPLIILDKSLAQASYDVLIKELRVNLAKEARLLAERDSRLEIMLAGPIDEGLRIEKMEPLLEEQRRLLISRRNAREGQKEVLHQQILQLKDEIGGYESQIAGQTKQLALIREEAKGVEELLEKGYERRPRLLALQRTESELFAQRASNQALLAKAKTAIAETKAEIASIDTQHREDVETQLAEVAAKLAEVRKKLPAARNILSRTVVTAPVAGTVVEMQAHTIGGVIAAGGKILDIVPRDEELLIDARISPNDIDEVRPGLTARVIMTGYAQRNMPRLEGNVRTVSADRIVDTKSGEVYYKARIELPAERVRSVSSQIDFKPGMPAEVMVMTGERTVLDYMIEPIAASFRKSFRES